MMVRSFVTAALLTVYHSALALAAFESFEARAGVCDAGIYGELAPILKPYPIAQAFCTSYFPVKCTSTAAVAKRRATTTTTFKTSKSSMSSTTLTTSKPATSSSSKSTQNPISSAWSKCQQQGAGVVSTMCSCIQSARVSRK